MLESEENAITISRLQDGRIRLMFGKPMPLTPDSSVRLLLQFGCYRGISLLVDEKKHRLVGLEFEDIETLRRYYRNRPELTRRLHDVERALAEASEEDQTGIVRT